MHGAIHFPWAQSPAPTPGGSMPPRPHISSIPIHALRYTLETVVQQPKGSEHRIHCATSREALSLRARMNRLRATDRLQNYNTYVAANKALMAVGRDPEPMPDGANRSIFDDLIFRVEGPTLIVQVGGVTAADLLSMMGLLPEGAPPPENEQGFAPPQAPAPDNYQGDYDTAPKADEDPFA